MTPPIAIIGAGPSGLTLARLLHINNIDFVIYDRDSSGDQEGQGGSLDIHENSGQLALKEAGIFEGFQKVARYEDQTMRMMDQQGTQIFVHEGPGGDRPEVDRKALRTLLLSSVPGEKIRWNSRVKQVTRQDNGSMVVRFLDGTVERGFKLVVGADGAWSKVRPLITSAKPEYSGLCYIQTLISPGNPIYSEVQTQVGRGTCIALGDKKQLITQRMGDGTYNVYAGLRLPEEWSRDNPDGDTFNEKCRRLLDQEFADWTPEVTRWFKQGDKKYRAWPLYAMPVESLSWQSAPGVTVVGDAAHVSTPFAGEGVNCSMHDSLQLAKAILKFGEQSLDEAVADYEESMLPRGIHLISKSKKNGEIMFAEDAARRFLEKFSAPLKRT